MAREKKVVIGAVNITMHPHTPKKYIKLFNHASKEKIKSRISHNTAGLISGARYYEREKRESLVISGDLYRFGDIDWESDWFNVETNQEKLKGVKS